MRAIGLQMGLPRGAYFERPDPSDGWLDLQAGRLTRSLATRRRRLRRRRSVFLARVASLRAEQAGLSDERLAGWARGLGLVLRRSDFAFDPVARSLALTSELFRRRLDGWPDDEDLWAARLMLEGGIVEMCAGSTGTATSLAAITAALTGIPVHVVHDDDDAAARTREELSALYGLLELRAGLVAVGAPAKERQAGYACEVTYCHHKQLAFDYLRDRILLGQDPERSRLLVERLHAPRPRLEQVLLRGLGFALVEDAVALLVDAARVPLVIGDRAGAAEEEREVRRAHELAVGLAQDVHYFVDTFEQEILLTSRGRLRIQEATQGHGGAWESPVQREELVRMALLATELARRGRDYVVEGDEVERCDEAEAVWLFDGTWERGLQRAVEVKEGTALSVHTEPRGRLSYQRLFRRYARVTGTAPAAVEARAELGQVYGLATVDLEQPAAREEAPPVLHATFERCREALGRRLAALCAEGRAVLAFVPNEETAQGLAAELAGAGVAYTLVTDADAQEAYARSCEPGQVTVAVPDAIPRRPFGQDGGEQGAAGPHVVLVQRHGARHVRRALAARGATRECPGSFEAWGSLDDPFLVEHGPSWLRRLAARRVDGDGVVPLRLAKLVVWQAHRSHERKDRETRRDLMALEEQYASRLAFAGGSDA